MSKLRRFSHSLIEAHARCPKFAMYRYVEEIPSPKGKALIKGSACDAAWNHDLMHKIDTGKDLPVDDLLELTEQAFKQESEANEVDWEGSSADVELAAALRLTRTWRTQLAPDIEPTAVQVRYSRTLPSGREFLGFVDIEGAVDGAAAVIDNKTASRKFAAGDTDKSLQPYAYAYLKEAPIDFVFARAIDTGKSQSSEFAWTHRSTGDIDWYTDLVSQVERGWEAEIFPPNPTGPFCGPTKCPFFERCQPHRTVSGPAA